MGDTILVPFIKPILDNVVSDVVLKFLALHGFPEEALIANFSTLGIIALIVWPIYFLWHQRKEKKDDSLPVPDQNISDAIDYIVNDSIAVLKQPPAPFIAEFGPAQGQLVRQGRVQHQDALKKLLEQIISGNISVWGLRRLVREISFYENAPRPEPFENVLRTIPKDFWETNGLSYFFCFHVTEKEPQTAPITSQTNREEYTGLKLRRVDVERYFPKKFWTKRLWQKFRRIPRIKY